MAGEQTSCVDTIKLSQKNGSRVVLYGAGDAGRLIFRILKCCDIIADCFVDNAPEKNGVSITDGVTCYLPSEIEKANCITFICVSWPVYPQLYRKALADGFHRIIELSCVIDDVLHNHRECLREIFTALYEFPVDVDVIFPGNHGQKTELGGKTPIENVDRIAVFTGAFGDYDRVYEPKVYPDGIDYYYISDSKPQDLYNVSWINAKDVVPDNLESGIMRNRYVKMHASAIFPEYKYTIYFDANLEIVSDVSGFINRSPSGISCFSHYNRDCLYYEALQIVNYKRIIWHDAYEQMVRYLDEGMPLHYGLGEMPVIAIDHTVPIADLIMTKWWEEFNNGARRDQLSFMYVLWKLGLNAKDISSIGNEYRHADGFVLHKHINPSMNVKRKAKDGVPE